ncbi:MAG: hypothetical protein M3416_02080 [Acidobacteriota bacterium]|nr:hypothetical protein [Acidobacteriota bacterium]
MTDERIIAYLLRELPAEEAERFEEECFAGESWPAQISSVEEDLIDAYLRGELTPERHQCFRQNYLTTAARRQRVAMAAALLRYVDTLPDEVEPDEVEPVAPAPPAAPTWAGRLIAVWGRQTWALRAGVAVAVIAIIAGSLWLFRQRAPEPRTFATLALTIIADDTRDARGPRPGGGQPGRISLPPGTDALRVSLKLPGQPGPAARYRVELVNDGGGMTPLAAAGREGESVSVEIPAGQLKRGQYVLRLFAVRPDGAQQRIPGHYSFIIE